MPKRSSNKPSAADQTATFVTAATLSKKRRVEIARGAANARWKDPV
jgi:hypothetical protein